MQVHLHLTEVLCPLTELQRTPRQPWGRQPIHWNSQPKLEKVEHSIRTYSQRTAIGALLVASISKYQSQPKTQNRFPNCCRIPLQLRFVRRSILQLSLPCNALNNACFRSDIEFLLMEIESEMQSWSPRFSHADHNPNLKIGSQIVVEFLSRYVLFEVSSS